MLLLTPFEGECLRIQRKDLPVIFTRTRPKFCEFSPQLKNIDQLSIWIVNCKRHRASN